MTTQAPSNECDCPRGSYWIKHTAGCYERRIESLEKLLSEAVQSIGALQSDPPALPPVAEWYLVGEARRSWPDDKRLVQWEDYMALREFTQKVLTR